MKKSKLKKLLKESERKLNIANGTVAELFDANDSLKKQNSNTIAKGLEMVDDISKMYEGQMRICEKEHERKDVILNYLETKDLK